MLSTKLASELMGAGCVDTSCPTRSHDVADMTGGADQQVIGGLLVGPVGQDVTSRLWNRAHARAKNTAT